MKTKDLKEGDLIKFLTQTKIIKNCFCSLNQMSHHHLEMNDKISAEQIAMIVEHNRPIKGQLYAGCNYWSIFLIEGMLVYRAYKENDENCFDMMPFKKIP